MGTKNDFNKLATFGFSYGMLPQDNIKTQINKDIIDHLPKGTKEYFFLADGQFTTVKMIDPVPVFRCYAINYKNAKRKFYKWQKQNK